MINKFFKISALFLVILSLSACSIKKEVKINKADEIKKQTPVIENSKVYTCADAPVKISTLKVGDVFNGHVVKSVGGNICEENCADDFIGNIYFTENREVVGQLMPAEMGAKFYFIPDDKTWMPKLKTSNPAAVLGLTCESPLYGFSFSEVDEKKILAVDPEFKKFLVQGDRSKPYPKKLTIEIGELSLHINTGGEPAQIATIKNIINFK